MSVRETLAAGRVIASQAMTRSAVKGPEADEETLTWILLSEVAWNSDRIAVRKFTRSEENRLAGADWLWWWEGENDSWFGCLVQAKRITPSSTGPTFDFDYQPRPTKSNPKPPKQIERLLAAADALDVPAAYMLYRSPAIGPASGSSCASIPVDWDTSAVTFVAATLVNEWISYPTQFDLAKTRPLECLACDGSCGQDMPLLAWYARNLADPAIREILSARPSNAARRAFRALFADVALMRLGQLRGAAPGPDQTHAGFELGAHFGGGIRSEAPWYVRTILNGDDPMSDLQELGGLAGIVVVTND